MIYEGPAPRYLPGTWRLLVRFEWPNGRSGMHATDPGTYQEAEELARCHAGGMPLEISDGVNGMCFVRVTGALLVEKIA